MIIWGQVCKARGWKASDKVLRLATFSEILGRKLESSNEIERLTECTKLMAELNCIIGVSVRAGRDAADPAENRARVLRNKITDEIVPCLELYVQDVAAYIAAIMEDKNRWWKIDRPSRGMTLMDLDAKPIFHRDRKSGELREFPSQLEQMVFTLSACLNGSGKMRGQKKSRLGFRVAAGHTLHEMKVKAGVPCDCAACGARTEAEKPMLTYEPF